MQKTKIDWADSTWNPITGCRHGCEYCYAQGITKRFGRMHDGKPFHMAGYECISGGLHVLNNPCRYTDTIRGRFSINNIDPFPFGNEPTFHRYRLQEPFWMKKPQNIFVVSMGDLIGNWVPDAWIQEVFDACQRAPWHRYIFLTKNPTRYDSLIDSGILPERQENMWYGTTCPDMSYPLHWNKNAHTFLSCEPMLAPWVDEQHRMLNGVNAGFPFGPEWVILGAETGYRRGKVVPERWWVEDAVKQCRVNGQKIFMKESLRCLMGEDFVQELPW